MCRTNQSVQIGLLALILSGTGMGCYTGFDILSKTPEIYHAQNQYLFFSNDTGSTFRDFCTVSIPWADYLASKQQSRPNLSIEAYTEMCTFNDLSYVVKKIGGTNTFRSFNQTQKLALLYRCLTFVQILKFFKNESIFSIGLELKMCRKQSQEILEF